MADAQHVRQHNEQMELLKSRSVDESGFGYESVTDAYAEGTEREVSRNRKRMAGSAAIAGATGLFGGWIGDHFVDGIWGHDSKIHSKAHLLSGNKGGSHEAGSDRLHDYNVTKLPTVGNPVSVEAGSGIIREIQQYADAQGHPVSGARASEIYENLRQSQGNEIIDLKGTDTYTGPQGDLRLAHPDAHAHWYEAAQRELDKELKKTT